MKFWIKTCGFVLISFLIGYPLLALALYGYNVRVWPNSVANPVQWFAALRQSWGWSALAIYGKMALGVSPGFAGGGAAEFYGAAALVALISGLSFPADRSTVERDPNGTYGDARFANRRERKRMSVGLELGLDLETNRPIRVAVRSNLLSIAPPRTGKTSGLVIPNLAAPEKEAWFGPCFVIDPKGESFRATAERRRALGREVRCLDPCGLVGGSDTLNPLQHVDVGDILGLQRVARALLPPFVGGESRYFQERAVDAIVATLLAAHARGTMTPVAVSRLLAEPDVLAKALVGLTAEPAVKMRALLAADPRTRDSIISTSMQAFQWVDDPRLQKLTTKSSFELRDLCAGKADLFLTLPTEDLETLAPLIRWILTEIFTAIRRNKPKERLLCIVDEAFALGRFREVVVASGELPGYNCSLWTFWQDRAQLTSTYGDADARTLMNTCEIATVSDPAMVDPDEREHWSRALGDYTIMEESRTTEAATPTKPARSTVATSPKAVRLRPAEALGRLPSDNLIVFPNSQSYAKRPLILRKTRHDDPRLRKFVKDIGGTAAAGPNPAAPPHTQRRPK